MNGKVMKRRINFGLLAVAFAMTSTMPANAHASLNLYGSTASANGYGVLFVRIPHGCDGKPTNRIIVRVPSEFQSVKPQWLGGWKTTRKLNSDKSVTVSWEGGPLPDDQFADFGLSVRYPTEMGTYFVPVTQRCGSSRVSWNQLPKDGVDSEYPAPSVKVGAPSGHSHG
jgi:periplasmic copper chaperone A